MNNRLPGDHRRAAGFSLLEIMIALLISAILTIAVMSTYNLAMHKVRRAEARAALYRAMQQEERYYSQNSSYYLFTPLSGDASKTSPATAVSLSFKRYSGEAPTVSAYEITASKCTTGETERDCIMLSATPGTAWVNKSYTDPACGALTLTSAGTKDTVPAGAAATCW